MRIDSVRTVGSDIVYYPFHTPRGRYGDTPYVAPSLDPNGGSWLGKRVVEKSNGTFIFDNYWNDSVFINTQANLGDSWLFYNDSGSTYYKAVVLSIDTMTVLSSVDSIKKIMINAFGSSGHIASDPLDSFIIILSKHNGFVQVFDLYTFPYHEPDSVYRLGLDFYWDRSTCTWYNINDDAGLPIAPNKLVSIFQLVDFINPNSQQLHNWNIGDVIESYHSEGIPIYGTVVTTYLRDTIIDKVVSGDWVHYLVTGTTSGCGPYYPCSLICEPGNYYFSDLSYPILGKDQAPEDAYFPTNYIFYFPKDTEYCLASPAYEIVLNAYNPWGLGWVMDLTDYKLGIGKVFFDHADGNPTYERDGLTRYLINGVNCGFPPIETKNVYKDNVQFSVYPNPAFNELTIRTTGLSSYSISLINPIGHTIFTINSRKDEVTINVRNISAGIYDLVIVNNEGKRHNQKVAIIH